MFDYCIRDLQASITLPIAHWLGKSVSPNQVSIVGFFAGVCCCFSLYMGFDKVGVVFFVLNRYLDMLDGALARATDQQTDFGGYFEIVLDFIIYAFVPFALVARSPDIAGLSWLNLMLSSFFVNSASLFYLAGILEKRQLGVRHT
mmetsp:Transcript_22823/g.41025  ORF Transcript_22823/g.41025 Transcript_22823/m.41025 type:complete len:145 (-) Transcript_22823:247-681(-)